MLEQEGRGEKSMVLNELTSGTEDPKSGGILVMQETRFLIKLTSGIHDPRLEVGGGTGVLLGTMSWLSNQ